MSIESRHAYRFGYLKSEQWSSVRLEALARELGKCQICGVESLSNDAHHIWYPEQIYDTRPDHLVILCRPCHNFVHAVLPECKTKDEDKGKQEWIKFRNAVIAWRLEKHHVFTHAYNQPTTPERVTSCLNILKQICSTSSLKQKRKAGETVRELEEIIDGMFFRKSA